MSNIPDVDGVQDGGKPLAGFKVLDVSNFLAAPMCSMFLADFGADVLKVERPQHGDEVRHWGENRDGVGLYYKVLNRGKRSITLDLRTPFGAETVKRLVQDVDVIVENYRTGTLEKWGLGYDVLAAINPRLIMTRVTGWGQTGPHRMRPGFGTLAEAYAGFVAINGEPDRPPLLPGFGLADSTTGLMAAFLTVTALHEARRSGRGQVIDLAIYETLLTLLGPQVVNYDQLGLVQQRSGSRLPFTAPRNTYRTRDGQYVSIAGSAQSTFVRICDALGVPDLVADPRFATNRARLVNAAVLDEHLQAAIERFDRDDLLARFVEIGATAAPVNTVADIVADAHIGARENIVTLDDPELGGPLRMQNVVGKLSRTPGAIAAPGPRLGEHNRAVLIDQLGYTEDELAAAGIDLPEPGRAAAE
ncbi:CoA transferase [Methylobacterium sp. NEAU 140]|uniref:CaiB/BaiF CoA transferase family protein n=1 Tax=Methylobacterium sp. NEAU 140 TaxID=3064945 RepID=UPI0027332958|nr:CoA transferase [Methylobacterium sp. NEAU 140]MDP4023973.1 CoA transferase [Methylobacterium sp. NEAU 140]